MNIQNKNMKNWTNTKDWNNNWRNVERKGNNGATSESLVAVVLEPYSIESSGFFCWFFFICDKYTFNLARPTIFEGAKNVNNLRLGYTYIYMLVFAHKGHETHFYREFDYWVVTWEVWRHFLRSCNHFLSKVPQWMFFLNQLLIFHCL